MDIEKEAATLVSHIASLAKFRFIEPDIPYEHMGATITDAMLQAGINYNAVVKPRIEALLSKHPEAKTTSGFKALFEKEGLETLIQWNGKTKIDRIKEVTNFFVREGIESESQMKIWLQNETNAVRLQSLKGIGNKTFDYFKILSGIHTSAIDRHLRKFLEEAGIEVTSYHEAQAIINEAANKLRINKLILDHSIWKYMSEARSSKSYLCGKSKTN